MLGVGHDVGCGDVGVRAYEAVKLAYIAAAEFFLLGHGECSGVADNAAFGAAQGDVRNGAFPGHPHREGAYGVCGFVWVETDAAFAWASGVVVEDSVGLEDLCVAIVHFDGDGEVQFFHWLAQECFQAIVKLELFGNVVELNLCVFIRVVVFV